MLNKKAIVLMHDDPPPPGGRGCLPLQTKIDHSWHVPVINKTLHAWPSYARKQTDGQAGRQADPPASCRRSRRRT
jgi:hypothetical protein